MQSATPAPPLVTREYPWDDGSHGIQSQRRIPLFPDSPHPPFYDKVNGESKSKDRSLYDADYSSLLVDANGDQYEPYSLAWRYLGMYIDCDADDDDDDDDDDDNNFDDDFWTRRLNNNGGNCERIILWAAYVDPGYSGGTIGEYQFYDLSTNSWDKSSCKTRRCARMDCHEPNTNFELVGVFKENDGLYDWAEQLFKHEGYCVWDDDTYEYMQTYRENWLSSCKRLYYYYDSDGNTLYAHTMPSGEGNITYGLYTDYYCSQKSTNTMDDYIYAYYGNSDAGEAVVTSFAARMENWNKHMNTYKICQPCRAYNLNKYGSSSSDRRRENQIKNNSKTRREEENDGQGDEEQWGYNCYDDAGYTNCNQCYKFESKTDMEAAETEDLERASAQGTILEIEVDGQIYGSGGFRSEPESSFSDISSFLSFSIAIASACAILYWIKQNNYMDKVLSASFSESFSVDSEHTEMT